MASTDPKTYTIPDAELQKIYAFALSLAQQAGKILLEGVDKRTGDANERTDDGQVDKMNAVDIVTQTDLGKFFFCLGIAWRREDDVGDGGDEALGEGEKRGRDRRLVLIKTGTVLIGVFW